MTLFSLIGSGIPTAAIPAGATAVGMGGLLAGLVAVSVLVLVFADRRRRR